MTSFVFIENRRLKHARAQHMVYQLKMIFGSGFQLAAYHTFTSKYYFNLKSSRKAEKCLCPGEPTLLFKGQK